ncbi:mitochondrial import inner membrane translocase subunit Tim9-like [Sycon ciliatum]|uniref:mitochondrial import inner membrane translocase subunit Tim9-like n=1 Tax=Sycon ciliatum TaxID=27933 RepID=UPI0031F6970C
MEDLHNYRQFLMQFNTMSEKCFTVCTADFSSRSLSQAEKDCVEACVNKHVAVNHRTMKQFLLVGPAADRMLQQGITPSADMAAMPPQQQQQQQQQQRR